jgi:hypothetical protein
LITHLFLAFSGRKDVTANAERCVQGASSAKNASKLRVEVTATGVKTGESFGKNAANANPELS